MATEIGPGSLDWSNPTVLAPGEQSTTAFDSSSDDVYYVIESPAFGAVRIDGLQSADRAQLYSGDPVPDSPSEHDAGDDRWVEVQPGEPFQFSASGYALQAGASYDSLPDVWENADGGVYKQYYPVYADFLAALDSVYPGTTDAEKLATFNEPSWVLGPVTITIRLSEVIDPDVPYPGIAPEVVEASESFEDFSDGKIATSLDGPYAAPGWTERASGGIEKPPLEIGSTDALALHVTSLRAQDGARSLRHSDYTWNLEQISAGRTVDSRQYGGGGPEHQEASCWHYRNGAHVGSEEWSVNYNGGGGLRGILSLPTDSLDWRFTTNGNAFDPGSAWLNFEKRALANLHFLLEPPGGGQPTLVDTGVYGWDSWVQQVCRFDLYEGTLRWELHGSGGLLWSYDASASALGVIQARAWFELDYVDTSGEYSEGTWPDWLDGLYAMTQEWSRTYTFPPYDVIEPDINGRLTGVRREFSGI